jgi:hypothetical protein
MWIQIQMKIQIRIGEYESADLYMSVTNDRENKRLENKSMEC